MGLLFIILGTLMWSLDTLIRYPLLGVIKPDTLVLVEHFFLVVYLLPLLFINKFQFNKLKSHHLLPFFVIGVLGSAASTLAFTKAFSLINPSLVILLQKLQPIVAISLSSLILKEKISAGFVKYASLAFFGAFLVSYPDIEPLFKNTENNNVLIGYLLTLLAVIGWGASTVFGKQLSKQNFSETEIMSGRFLFGFLFLIIFSFSYGTLPNSSLNLEIYVKILIMVFISGLIGMYLYYKGLKKLTAHTTAIAELFFPLSAIIINWIFLNKTLVPIQFIGAFVLILSSILMQKNKIT